MNLITGVFYEESQSDKTFEPHYHTGHEIIYVIDGRARFVVEGKPYDAKRGDLLLIGNFENHRAHVLTYPYKRYYMFLDQREFNRFTSNSYVTSLFRNRPPEFCHLFNVPKSHTDKFHSLFHAMMEEYLSSEPFKDLAAESKFMDFLVLFCRLFSPGPDPVKTTALCGLIARIQDHIIENYREDITLEGISKKFYIDMYYLSKQFKICTGYNFKKFLILQRISRARELLCHTDYPIGRIAAEAGFGNVNHFIRIFGKYTGLSPGKYRKELSKKEH